MNLAANKEALVLLGENITPFWIDNQLDRIIKKTQQNMNHFQDQFPSACATNGIYRVKENDDWTNGFWTGILWLCYEITGDSLFKEQAERNLYSFQKRLNDHFILDHHDIGFLYSLSSVAGFKITHNEAYRKMSLQAADILLTRFQEKGSFLQAWGKIGDPKEYRLIIDSLLNLPLLFEASIFSGDQKYKEYATRHFRTLLNTVIKMDGTSYHTYYFDPKTGSPLYGATRQGNSDQSIWARGQSWAILGIPLNEKYIHDNPFPEIYQSIVEVFLGHLPKDLICYWDFDFTDEHPSDKDSSAAAIVADGLLVADSMNAYPHAKRLAKGLLFQLGTYYVADEKSEGFLSQGVYSHAEEKGVNEPNLWGDYFYLEALVRLKMKNPILFW